MINTEVFEYDHYNNYACFEKVLESVNDLIKEKEIKKSDIIEYRTENWSKKDEDGEAHFYYRATLSWWK